MILQGKRVLVVGAAGLLGREIVKSVINEGGRVIAADINAESLTSLRELSLLDSIEFTEIDITKKDSVVAAINYCVKKFGGIDAAVNSAYPRNRNYGRKVFDVTYEDFSENISLHLGGYFIFMQQCAEYALKNKTPFSLVNISSVYGVIAPKFDVYDETHMTMPVEYAAIKSGLLHLNKYFTSFMKGTDFRVNSVSPGGLLDGQDALFLERYKSYCASKGMLDVDDVLGAIIFLLSSMSAYIKGQNIIVDDGYIQ